MGILDSDKLYSKAEEEQFKTKSPLIDRILLNPWIRLGAVLFLFAIIIPVIIYIFFYNKTIKTNSEQGHCSTHESYRIPCGILNYTIDDCIQKQCCYNYKEHTCYHQYPSMYYYKWNEEDKIYKRRLAETPVGNENHKTLSISVNEVSSKILFVTIGKKIEQNHLLSDKTDYNYTVGSERLNIDVTRSGTKELLFTTSQGPIIASNGYWELVLQITNETLYGLGGLELKGNVKKIFYNNQTNDGLPIVIAHQNGKFHGLLVMTMGVFEIEVLQSKLLILRTISFSDDNFIKIGLVTGPTPKDVIKQIRSLTPRPKYPPFWSLGVHICRDSQDIPTISSTLSEENEFRTKATGSSLREEKHIMPYDSECLHENIFSLTMNTNDNEKEELRNTITQIKNLGKRFLMTLSPQIASGDYESYEKAKEKNILYREETCEIIEGSYLRRNVTFPKYEKPLGEDWFSESIKNVVGNDLADGFVLKDTSPFNANRTIVNETNFPYMTQDLNESMSFSIPWNATTCKNDRFNHIEDHNAYGLNFTSTVSNTLIGAKNNPFLLTSSSLASIHHAFGIHREKVDISWYNLKTTITHALFHNLFGNPMVSTPLCGSTDVFDYKLHEKLCIRWYITAATLPVFRISSSLPRRDPFSLGSKYATEIAIDSIKKRYSLVLYMYSLLLQREPIVRPMFYEFFKDNVTLGLDSQYMIGDSLLVSQIIYFDHQSLNTYLPKNVTWYEYWNGEKRNSGWDKNFVTDNDWIMYIAGGTIIPIIDFQNLKGNSAEEMRTQPFSLAIALQCSKNLTSLEDNEPKQLDCFAGGIYQPEINWPTLEFNATYTEVVISNIIKFGKAACTSPQIGSTIEAIIIYGIDENEKTRKNVDVDLCKIEHDKHVIKFV